MIRANFFLVSNVSIRKKVGKKYYQNFFARNMKLYPQFNDMIMVIIIQNKIIFLIFSK